MFLASMLILLGVTGFVHDVSAQQESIDPAKGTTWLILRHAEREGRADQLSDAGKERAKVLAQLGAAFRASAVYSTQFRRTRDTVTPMAEALKLEVKTYPVDSYDWLQQAEQENEGQVVVVVGHSNTTGELVEKLSGIKPAAIEHDQYDRLFMVRTGIDRPTVIELPFGSNASDESGKSLRSTDMAPIGGKSGGK